MYTGLPEICYVKNDITGEIIVIKRGVMGYYKTDIKEDVDLLNSRLGITKAQAEAMKVGSMFGWDCKGANPSYYDKNGKLRKEFL